MQLFKRDKTWWLRWGRDGVKHRESTHCTDKTAALLVLKRRERELADPVHHAANKATVASAAKRLIGEQTKSCKSPATLEVRRQKLGHIGRLLGDVRMSDLDHAKVLAYTETREAEGAHTHTVHKELQVLRLLIKSATRAGEYSRDYKTVIPEYSARYVPRTRWLTEDEVIAVCRALPPGRAAAVAFAVATSANYSETFNARRGDVQGAGVKVRGQKTATRNRTVPVMVHTWPLLAFVLAHADGGGVALFRPWSDSNMNRDIKRACVKAGIAPFSSNDLRRTCATWLVKAGVPYALAAKVLGHSNTLMLQRVYGQMDHGDVGRLINAHLIGAHQGHAGGLHHVGT